MKTGLSKEQASLIELGYDPIISKNLPIWRINLLLATHEKLINLGFSMDQINNVLIAKTTDTGQFRKICAVSQILRLTHGFSTQQIIDILNVSNGSLNLIAVGQYVSTLLQQGFLKEQIIRMTSGGPNSIQKVTVLVDEFIKYGFSLEQVSHIASVRFSYSNLITILEHFNELHGKKGFSVNEITTLGSTTGLLLKLEAIDENFCELKRHGFSTTQIISMASPIGGARTLQVVAHQFARLQEVGITKEDVVHTTKRNNGFRFLDQLQDPKHRLTARSHERSLPELLPKRRRSKSASSESEMDSIPEEVVCLPAKPSDVVLPNLISDSCPFFGDKMTLTPAQQTMNFGLFAHPDHVTQPSSLTREVIDLTEKELPKRTGLAAESDLLFDEMELTVDSELFASMDEPTSFPFDDVKPTAKVNLTPIPPWCDLFEEQNELEKAPDAPLDRPDASLEVVLPVRLDSYWTDPLGVEEESTRDDMSLPYLSIS